jgi:Pyruvate/2-oxoacid:ferredoxin oxidoreductase delta subunit
MELNEDVSFGSKGGFSIIRPVLDADFIINCPKLKTHGLTVMSGGVKNLFGCVPGLQKPEQHCLHPSVEGFSEMLLSLAETVRLDLTVMDAVDCMEGNGPGGGKVRVMNCTLASRDVYALDEAAATLMALNPQMAPLVRHARGRGLCRPEAVTIIGNALDPADPPFTLSDAILKKERFFSVNGLFHHFFGRKRTYPVIVAEKCVGCGRCAESCPRQIIDVVDRKAVISRKGCISCFCCQEMCPEKAIDVVRKRAW